MRITQVYVENFRCFDEFSIDLAGESRLLVGENAIGKSSLITAIARGLGRDRGFQRSDFLDESHAIQIRITLTGLNAAQLGVFAECADFGSPTSLTVGATAVWDADTEECEVTLGYPTKAWKQSNRTERESIDTYLIADARAPSKLLQFGTRTGLLADVLSQVDVGTSIAETVDQLRAASAGLASEAAFQAVLDGASDYLRKVLPSIGSRAYGIDVSTSTELSVLRQLQLTLEYGGRNLPVASHSSGLNQLTMFAFSLLSIAQKTDAVLLIDEPELSLHPQSQRALLRLLRALPNQSLVVTHSASILDRADPRNVVRLHQSKGRVCHARPVSLSKEEASRLSRFTSPQNAEAFFARTAVLVEGESDKYAIEALAARVGKNLDSDGTSIVVMTGAGSIRTFLALLGPEGLKVRLAGMCDASDEASWAKALQAAGCSDKVDRQSMEAAGFFVCDSDLENVLIAALGEQPVLDLIDRQGETTVFSRFANQPGRSGQSLPEQLHDFLHSRGRQITYAPPLVDLLDLNRIPAPLKGVLDAI